MTFWRNKTVTVFGGTGFIGRYLVQRLARLGARLVVASRHPDAVLALKPRGDVGQIVGVYGTLGDEAFLRHAMQNSDAVVNLVGILYETRRQRFQAIHAEFPARLGRVAAALQVPQLLHVSALGANAQSKSLYARSKAAGEAGLLAVYPGAIILRPSLIFGAEDNFFNRFAKMATISPVLPLIGGGHTLFQPVFVSDVADAIVAALADDRAKGQIYKLGGPEIYSFKKLLQIMLRIIQRRCWLVSIPWPLALLQAALLQCLPGKLLTMDQVWLLKDNASIQPKNLSLLDLGFPSDAALANIEQISSPDFTDLGIEPTALETIIPTYLARYRPH